MNGYPKILTVNAGSSSLRLAAFVATDGGLSRLASGHFSGLRNGLVQILRDFLKEHGIGEVAVVAHRVVHGGARFRASRLLDRETELEIERLIPLAPLHNPPALAGVRACRTLFGVELPQVAVFDTAFYADLPEAARTYAIPHDLASKHGLRRYGFHGIAHQAQWRRWRELRPDIREGGRVISLQLGAGCSMTAVERGVARDTSMGFSPLEGLMMATRGGDVDPGVITWLQRRELFSPEVVERLLYYNCGLQGVAGESDMRRLLARDDVDARLAIEMYCYRARKYLGAYLAVLGGAEAILFGGGVAENAPPIREGILADMEWAGIMLDAQANRATVGTEARISRPQSRVEVWVIPVDEATILAQEAVAVTRSRETTGRKEVMS
ncbi:MAG: acetate/propionate family kinase [Pseudomonadota bacterium]